MLKMLTPVALAAALTAAPALAQASAYREGGATISHADLDLASAEGRAALDARIRGAARRLCGPTIALELVRTRSNRECFASAVAGARRQAEQQFASQAPRTVLASR